MQREQSVSVLAESSTYNQVAIRENTENRDAKGHVADIFVARSEATRRYYLGTLINNENACRFAPQRAAQIAIKIHKAGTVDAQRSVSVVAWISLLFKTMPKDNVARHQHLRCTLDATPGAIAYATG